MSGVLAKGQPEMVYRNRYQQVTRRVVEFAGITKEYFVTEFGERIGVVFLRADAVLLVRQYRLFLNGLSWEIPGEVTERAWVPLARALAMIQVGEIVDSMSLLALFAVGLRFDKLGTAEAPLGKLASPFGTVP